MTELVLVKHAPPEITRDVVPSRWVLSEEGHRRCDWLAGELKTKGVSRLYSSLEPKALETAALVAARIGLTVEPWLNLHENDRNGFGFQEVDELRRRLREFFERPAQLTIGNETADGALQRFAGAVADILSRSRGRNFATVTHGTALSRFVAHHNTIRPFDLWERLGMPSYVVLDATSFSFDGQVQNYPAHCRAGSVAG
jgi:2,3-bisphosphoglycerate-dependent phosphoglycerate mutase